MPLFRLLLKLTFYIFIQSNIKLIFVEKLFILLITIIIVYINKLIIVIIKNIIISIIIKIIVAIEVAINNKFIVPSDFNIIKESLP